MIYLSGCVMTLPRRDDLGYLLTPAMGNRPDLSTWQWGADNACFSQGDAFRMGRFITWLEERMCDARGTCHFAVAPDVVGDAEATWRRSAPLLPLLRAMGWRAALVAQDGMEHLPVDWDAFDVLFIGGSTAWKLSPMAAQLVAEAKCQRKWVHMGRVNSGARLRYADNIGCDSVDGTFLKYGPDTNLPRLVSWLDALKRQPALWNAA